MLQRMLGDLTNEKTISQSWHDWPQKNSGMVSWGSTAKATASGTSCGTVTASQCSSGIMTCFAPEAATDILDFLGCLPGCSSLFIGFAKLGFLRAMCKTLVIYHRWGGMGPQFSSDHLRRTTSRKTSRSGLPASACANPPDPEGPPSCRQPKHSQCQRRRTEGHNYKIDTKAKKSCIFINLPGFPLPLLFPDFSCSHTSCFCYVCVDLLLLKSENANP